MTTSQISELMRQIEVLAAEISVNSRIGKNYIIVKNLELLEEFRSMQTLRHIELEIEDGINHGTLFNELIFAAG